MTSSSRRSSSSYRSSSRYSTSSSYRSEGSLGGSSECLDPLFEPFLDCEDNSSLFGEDSPGGPGCLAPFSRHSRPSYGHTGEWTEFGFHRWVDRPGGVWFPVCCHLVEVSVKSLSLIGCVGLFFFLTISVYDTHVLWMQRYI